MTYPALCLALFAVPAIAETRCIQFDQMPVGCRFYREGSAGEREITEYIGKEGGNHIMETYTTPEETRLIRRTAYSQEGYMIRLDDAEGGWETYSPGLCIYGAEQCSYVVRDSAGKERKVEADNVRSGNQVTVRFRDVGEAEFRTMIVTIGQLNMPEMFREGDDVITIKRYEDCSLGS